MMKKCILWMLTLLLVTMCVLPQWNSAQAASGKTVYILDSGVRIVLPSGTTVETEQERKATYSAPYGVFNVTVDMTKWALKENDDFAGYCIQYNGIDMYVEEKAANSCAVRFNGNSASYTVNFLDLHGNARSLVYDVFGISGPTDDPTDTPTDSPADPPTDPPTDTPDPAPTPTPVTVELMETGVYMKLPAGSSGDSDSYYGGWMLQGGGVSVVMEGMYYNPCPSWDEMEEWCADSGWENDITRRTVNGIEILLLESGDTEDCSKWIDVFFNADGVTYRVGVYNVNAAQATLFRAAINTMMRKSAATPTPAPVRLPGDANDDGKVDINDVLRILQHIAGWNVSLDLEHVDVNASGSVDLQDALLILRYVSGEDVDLQ